MTPSMLRDSEDAAQRGESVSVGALPDLDPISAPVATLWSTLRASTPGDQPISIPSIRALVPDQDENEFRRTLQLIQLMDRVLFDWQRIRREEERKRAESKAKQKQRAKGRR